MLVSFFHISTYRDHYSAGLLDMGVLFTENGPQFDSRELTAFSTDWQFQHITSSPRYPQPNGEVERAV